MPTVVKDYSALVRLYSMQSQADSSDHLRFPAAIPSILQHQTISQWSVASKRAGTGFHRRIDIDKTVHSVRFRSVPQISQLVKTLTGALLNTYRFFKIGPTAACVSTAIADPDVLPMTEICNVQPKVGVLFFYNEITYEATISECICFSATITKPSLQHYSFTIYEYISTE